MKYTFKPEAVELFKEAFTHYSHKPPKPFNPVRIKVNGNYVQTASGKTLWKTVGHAKSALKHHVGCCDDQFRLRLMRAVYGSKLPNHDYPYHGDTEVWRAFIKHLEETGVLEFVPA